jgi:hypothetical protein
MNFATFYLIVAVCMGEELRKLEHVAEQHPMRALHINRNESPC